VGEREGGGIPEANFFVVAVDVDVVAVVSFVVVSLATSKCTLPGETITGFGCFVRPLLRLLALTFFLAHAFAAGDDDPLGDGGSGGGPEGRGGCAEEVEVGTGGYFLGEDAEGGKKISYGGCGRW